MLRSAVDTAATSVTGDTTAAKSLEAKLAKATAKYEKLQAQLKTRAEAARGAERRGRAPGRAQPAGVLDARPRPGPPAATTTTTTTRKTRRTRKTMTERILPAISIPVPARRGAEGVARPRPAAVARPAVVAHRKDAFLTMPARAGMLLGASAAVYAVTLAGVSALQSSSDAAIAARRQPYLDAIAATRATNDALEAALLAADAEARALASEYAAVGANVAEYQARARRASPPSSPRSRARPRPCRRGSRCRP